MTFGNRSRFALLLAMLSVSAFAEEPKPVSHPEELGFVVGRLERVTQAFQGYVDSGQIPGAVVLIARNDKVAYFRAFGYRDRERNIAMTTDAIFRLASMTKPIVSVAAMMLVEDGKLDLAAPVAQYLPEFAGLQVGIERQDPATGKTELTLQAQARPMIVQDLLRHTSGLIYPPPIGSGPVAAAYRDVRVQDRNQTLAELVTKLSKLPLAYQPGDAWVYSIAPDVLGRVIEIASGMELDRFIDERLAKPLGMTSTGFYVADAERDRIAQPQVDAASGKPPPMFDATQRPKFLSGANGGLSTASDYWRLCEMLLNRGKFGDMRLLSPSTVALMTANALRPNIGFTSTVAGWGDASPTPAMGQSFGLGFAVRTETGQNPLPGSVGSFYWIGGFGTTFYIDPREKLIIVMMVQQPGTVVATAPYRHAIRYLTYQALTPAD